MTAPPPASSCTGYSEPGVPSFHTQTKSEGAAIYLTPQRREAQVR
jgi:hypothetical protein